MKILSTFLCICFIVNTNTSFAFALSEPGVNKPGATKAINSIKAIEFVKLSAKDISLITGKKMNIWNRLSFSILKMRMKHDLKKDPNLTIADYTSKNGKHRLGVGWIILSVVALGILFFVLIVLCLAKGDKG